MVFSLTYHDFEDFGAKPAKRRPSRIPVDGSKPVYVPYFPAKANPPKNIADLIDSKQRVYIPGHMLQDEDFLQFTYSDDFKKQLDEVHDTGKVLLDLGTEPLRRIVQELKRLSNSEIAATHDPLAARNAGLMPYCNYLQGNESNAVEDRRKKRKSKLVKKRTEMIIQGTLSKEKYQLNH